MEKTATRETVMVVMITTRVVTRPNPSLSSASSASTCSRRPRVPSTLHLHSVWLALERPPTRQWVSDQAAVVGSQWAQRGRVTLLAAT